VQAVRVVSVLGVLAALAAAFWFMAPRGATTQTPPPATASKPDKGPVVFGLVPTIDDRFTAEPCNRVKGAGLSALAAFMAEIHDPYPDFLGVSMGDLTLAAGAVGRRTVVFHYGEVVPNSGVRFVAAGEGELSTGSAYVREVVSRIEGVTFLCGNATDPDGQPLMRGWTLLRVGERGVLLVGVAAESLQAGLDARGSDVRLGPAAETAARACADGLADARGKGIDVDLVALFVHGTVDEAAAVVAKVPGVTFAVAAHGADLPDLEPRRVNGVPVYFGGRGLRFAWRLLVPGDGSAPAASLSRIGSRYSERPSPHTKALEFFRETLSRQFFEEAVNTPGDRPRDPRGDYVGGERCCDCHADVGAQHAASPHGTPSAALLDSNFAGSSSCVGCHTTAPYWDGGWRGPKDRSSMAGVSCEACHGPGQAHAMSQSRGYGKVEFSRCLECHLPDRSPGFDPEEAWKRSGHRLVR
jgi:cytochrome c554/c'-like protein